MHIGSSTFSRRLTESAVVAVMIAVLASGCSTTTTAVTSPAAGAALTPASKSNSGDVIIFGTPVTDEAGTYQRTTISPKLPVYTTAFSPADGTLQPTFTTAEVLSAQQWILRFVSEESTDSIALDSTLGWNRWKAQDAPKFIAAEKTAAIMSSSGNSDRSGVIYNNANEAYPMLMRDSKPRVKTSQIKLQALNGFVESGATFIHAAIQTVMTYRLSSGTVVDYVAKITKVTPEAALAATPELGAAGTHSLRITTDWNYYVAKNGKDWSIVGYNQQSVGQAAVDPYN